MRNRERETITETDKHVDRKRNSEHLNNIYMYIRMGSRTRMVKYTVYMFVKMID